MLTCQDKRLELDCSVALKICLSSSLQHSKVTIQHRTSLCVMAIRAGMHCHVGHLKVTVTFSKSNDKFKPSLEFN